MKRVIAVIIAALLVLALAACGETAQPATEAQNEVIDGGYSDSVSPVITDEIKALVEKAAAELDGATYTPVAYVASQVVAGTNHVILCKVAPVVPDAVAHYDLVTIYEDLEGNAEITSVVESGFEAPPEYDPENPMSGAYAEPESPVVTDEAKTALEKACETLTGAEYEPVALLGAQVVAGMNYRLLCKATPSTAGLGGSYYTIVTVYADLSGGAEITETADLVSETAETAEEQFETSQAE